MFSPYNQRVHSTNHQHWRQTRDFHLEIIDSKRVLAMIEWFGIRIEVKATKSTECQWHCFVKGEFKNRILLSADVVPHLSILLRKMCMDWVIILEKAAYGKLCASDKYVCVMLLLQPKTRSPDSLISNNKSCARHISYTHRSVRLRCLSCFMAREKNCRLKMDSLPCDFNLCLYLRLINKIQCLVSNRPLWFQTIHGRVSTEKKSTKESPERTKCGFSSVAKKNTRTHNKTFMLFIQLCQTFAAISNRINVCARSAATEQSVLKVSPLYLMNIKLHIVVNLPCMAAISRHPIKLLDKN